MVKETIFIQIALSTKNAEMKVWCVISPEPVP
jgi:hypothetical protein